MTCNFETPSSHNNMAYKISILLHSTVNNNLNACNF